MTGDSAAGGGDGTHGGGRFNKQSFNILSRASYACYVATLGFGYLLVTILSELPDISTKSELYDAYSLIAACSAFSVVSLIVMSVYAKIYHIEKSSDAKSPKIANGFNLIIVTIFFGTLIVSIAKMLNVFLSMTP